MRIKVFSILRILMAIAACLLLLPHPVLYADKVPDTRENVDVGIVLQPGIAMPTDNGVYLGFDVEFMYKIAQYGNMKVVYHPYKNNVEMFQALDEGEIQMALGISPTPEREQKFLFASNGFFTGQASIRVRNDDNRFSYGNPVEFDGKKLGVVKSSIMYELALKWAEKNGIQPEFKLYDDEKQLYNDMDTGMIDGVIGTAAKVSRNYRSAYNITTNTYYPIFAKNQQLLKNKVDAVMNRILYEDALFPKKLFDKYRSYQINESLPLTNEELQYIANHPVLRVGILENLAPFSIIDSRGQALGISPDLYRQIAKELNWQVEFKAYKDRQQLNEALRAREVDVYGITTQDIITSEENGLALTRSFVTLNIFIMMRTDVKEAHTAAYIGRMPPNVERMLRDRMNNVEFRAYNSLDECFDAMMDHKVDALFCNTAQLNWLTVRRGGEGFVVESVDNMYSECCGQLLPENYLLNSILSKTVENGNIDVLGIVSQYIYSSPTAMDVIRAIPTRIVVAFFVVLLIITIIISRTMYTSHQRRVAAELNAKQVALEASEQARQAESNFLSSMSHDMRTPLNGILGYTRLARGADKLDDIRQYLERIDSSGKLMLALVNDILDLSKLESGKMELREDMIRFREHFDKIRIAISMNAESHHIDFKAASHVPDEMVIYSDQLRLQQISMNLLSNAIKYTPAEGHVQWDVSLIEEGNRFFLLEIIKDDGIGMSEEFQQHMFEIFTQETRQETINSRGTGLGLSLVHKFVTLFDGSIHVESNINQGSTFTVKIPVRTGLLQAQTQDSPEQVAGGVLEGLSRTLLKDVPVLMVEDNDINAELTQLLLQEYGANMIDWVHNGQEAVELYSASEPEHYRVILMDLRMPVMDGITAARKIRSLHRMDALSVPIIAMSADAYKEDINRCLEAGMQDHISKPIDINRLISAIAAHI